MLSFLFWNLNGNDIPDLVAETAFSVNADCIALCECAIEPARLLGSLNRNLPEYRFAPSLAPTNVQYFTRFDQEFFLPRFESKRTSIRSLRLPAKKELLV